jgi:hypothetical protein
LGIFSGNEQHPLSQTFLQGRDNSPENAMSFWWHSSRGGSAPAGREHRNRRRAGRKFASRPGEPA